MRLQPTTPTCLRTETTPSSALRWTRPCPVPLVRWGNPRARFVFLLRWRRREIQWMSVIYDERMVSDCSIMSLWPASTNSLSYSASCAFKFCCLSHLSFVILSPLLISVLFFGYWLFSFHLFLSFHLSFCLSGFFFTSLISLFFFSVSIQSFSSSSSRPPRFPSLFPPFSPFLYGSPLLYRPGSFVSLWCWPPACVCVCVCSCTRPDLPEQRAPARLFAAGCWCGREQQRHAGHRGWPGFVCAAVSCHQFPRFCVRISLWQHERWDIKWLLADPCPWCLTIYLFIVYLYRVKYIAWTDATQQRIYNISLFARPIARWYI